MARVSLWSTLPLALVILLVTIEAHTGTQDGAVNLSPEAAIEQTYIDDLVEGGHHNVTDDTTNAAEAKMLPPKKDPEGGVMSVGSSYIVQKRNSTAFTESERNKTSNSPYFVPKSCSKHEHCFQSFATITDGERFCDGAPEAQEGIGMNEWTLLESREIGCVDHPKNSDKQMCELWDEFFIKVNKEGEVSFKWESMHNGTDRKQVIPVIKVAEVGKCFNKCNILRHPEVLRAGEPRLTHGYVETAKAILEFGRLAGCDCCDFQTFMSNGQSCRNYELDPSTKIWQFTQFLNGSPYEKGPKCPEYWHKLGPGKLASTQRDPIPPGDAVLVDDDDTEYNSTSNQYPDDMADIDPRTEVDSGLGIRAPSAAAAPVPPPQNSKGKVWDAPHVPFVRDPFSNNKQGAEKTTLNDELSGDPDKVESLDDRDTRKEIERIQGWSASKDDLPSAKKALKLHHTSLKREMHVVVPKPKPVVLPPEVQKPHKKKKYEQGAGYVSELEGNYSAHKEFNMTTLASEVSDQAQESEAMNLINGIQDILKNAQERKEIMDQQLKTPE